MSQFLRTDLTDEQWELLRELIPPAKKGGRPRTVEMGAVINAIFYVLIFDILLRQRRGIPKHHYLGFCFFLKRVFRNCPSCDNRSWGKAEGLCAEPASARGS